MGKTSAAFNIIFGAKTGKLSKDLKGVQRQMAILQRNLSQTGRQLTVGLTAPLAAIGASAFKVASDFESSMSKVKAVSGATGAEFKQLEQLAKDLGKSTVFTASDVAGLEEAFARLGFSTDEILNATEATLQLAQASGTDLANAADVAGSTLRAFGLDASETGRVADVMASSFSQTALDVDSFQEAMKMVAPVAASAGLSVEQTTALLGSLSNSGVRGSQAGTALRRIISELGATSGDVAGEIEKLAAEGLNLADAKDEVGRNAQSALLILADSIKTTDELTKSLEASEGAAADMAATMDDNAKGGIKRMQSAVEGAQIALGEALSPTVTAVAEKLAGLANSFSNLSSGAQKSIASLGIFAAGLGPVASTLGGMVGGLKDAVKGFKALRLAMLANPFGAIATAIGLVVGGLILLGNETDDAATATQKLAEQTKNLALAEQKRQVESAIEKQKALVGLLEKERDAKKEIVDAGVGGKAVKEFNDSQKAVADANAELLEMQGLLTSIEENIADPGKRARELSAQIDEQKKLIEGLKQEQAQKQAIVDQGFGGKAIAELKDAKTAVANANLELAQMEQQLLDIQNVPNEAPVVSTGSTSTTTTTTTTTVTGDGTANAPAVFDATRTATQELIDDLAKAELAIQSTFTVDGDATAQAQSLAQAYRGAAIAAAEAGEIDLSSHLQSQAEAYQKTADAAKAAAEAQLKASEDQKAAIENLAQGVQTLLVNIAGAFRQANADYRQGVEAVQEAFDNQQLSAEEFAEKQRQLDMQRKQDRANAVLDIIQITMAEAIAAMIGRAIKDAASVPGASIAGFLALPAITAGVTGLVKTAFSANIPAFAEGGAVTSPTLALLGDNPSGKEMVVPFEKLPQFLNMFQQKNAQHVHVTGVLQGKDIFLSASKSQRTTQRTMASFAI